MDDLRVPHCDNGADKTRSCVVNTVIVCSANEV